MNLCNNECTTPCNWDYLQLNFIKNNIKQTDKFVDLGVYQGQYLQFVLNLIPSQNITGVEMDILAFNYLNQRFGTTGAKLLNMAISNEKGTIDYFKGCDGGCPNIFGQHENRSFVGPKIGVIESTTLDDLFSDNPFDFIKIDIEGAEIQALEGGINVLKNTRIIMVECHTDTEFPSILNILINTLDKDVYCLKYFHKKTLESPFSYQIVAIDRNLHIENGFIKQN